METASRPATAIVVPAADDRRAEEPHAIRSATGDPRPATGGHHRAIADRLQGIDVLTQAAAAEDGAAQADGPRRAGARRIRQRARARKPRPRHRETACRRTRVRRRARPGKRPRTWRRSRTWRPRRQPVIAHIVLFRPKAGLTPADRARLLDALREAHRQIPRIHRFSVGTRMTLGTDYEAAARDFPYFVQLEFESREDLATYLTHPAHQQLGRGFYEMSEAAEAYDFAVEDMPGGAAALGLLDEN